MKPKASCIRQKASSARLEAPRVKLKASSMRLGSLTRGARSLVEEARSLMHEAGSLVDEAGRPHAWRKKRHDRAEAHARREAQPARVASRVRSKGRPWEMRRRTRRGAGVASNAHGARKTPSITSGPERCRKALARHEATAPMAFRARSAFRTRPRLPHTVARAAAQHLRKPAGRAAPASGRPRAATGAETETGRRSAPSPSSGRSISPAG